MYMSSREILLELCVIKNLLCQGVTEDVHHFSIIINHPPNSILST